MSASRLAYVLSMALLLSACGDPIPVRNEVLAVTHPDQSVTAIIVEERPSGSNREGVYRLYLHSYAQPIDDRWVAPMFTIKGLRGAAVSWRGRMLKVSYTAGELILAHGLWHDRRAPRGTAAYQVEVKFTPLCEGKCF